MVEVAFSFFLTIIGKMIRIETDNIKRKNKIRKNAKRKKVAKNFQNIALESFYLNDTVILTVYVTNNKQN